MSSQLLIGSCVITLSIVIHAVFIVFAIKGLQFLIPRLTQPLLFFKILSVLIATTLWLLAAHSLSVWLWAAIFRLLDIFDTLETALYFSLVSFTTLGFGDITLTPSWRILSGITATNGLLLFGFSTAFLFEVITHLYKKTLPAAPTKNVL